MRFCSRLYILSALSFWCLQTFAMFAGADGRLVVNGDSQLTGGDEHFEFVELVIQEGATLTINPITHSEDVFISVSDRVVINGRIDSPTVNLEIRTNGALGVAENRNIVTKSYELGPGGQLFINHQLWLSNRNSNHGTLNWNYAGSGSGISISSGTLTSSGTSMPPIPSSSDRFFSGGSITTLSGGFSSSPFELTTAQFPIALNTPLNLTETLVNRGDIILLNNSPVTLVPLPSALFVTGLPVFILSLFRGQAQRNHS